MKKTMKNFLQVILLATAAQSAFAAAPDTPDKDPARWYVEDATPQARYQTTRKEVAAAYKEALAACKIMRGAEKSACMKEARAIHDADLAQAKNLLAR